MFTKIIIIGWTLFIAWSFFAGISNPQKEFDAASAWKRAST